jgi:3-hydroxyisobutyrate dehydrogenase
MGELTAHRPSPSFCTCAATIAPLQSDSRQPEHDMLGACAVQRANAHRAGLARLGRLWQTNLGDVFTRSEAIVEAGWMTTKRIGYIGLGHLGGHLAASLQRAGHELVVHDLDRSLADRHVAAGAIFVATPAEVSAACDVVLTCLPSPRVIDVVVAGPGGLLEGFAEGGTWIDNSTNDQSENLRLAELCASRGINMLESPVTGGVHKAAAGEITVLVGGDEELYRRHEHLLHAIGDPVLYMGQLGNAAVIKVITNMLAFIHLVAAGEALMLAKRGGLDLAASFEAIKQSSGNSFVHETESQLVLNGSYDIGFTMDLACKDLGFATQFGREFGVPLDLAGLTEQTFIRARSQYGGGAWSTQVVKLLEDALHTDLRAEGFPEKLT